MAASRSPFVSFDRYPSGNGQGSDEVLRQDPARLAAVSATDLLDSSPEEAFDRITRLAARLLDAPVALISVLDGDRDFYKSACGLSGPLADAREITGSTLCYFAIHGRAPLVLPDIASQQPYCDLPNVRELKVGAYLGVPLVVGDQPVGTLCVADTKQHSWTDDDIEVITELAASAQREMQLRSSMATTRRVTAALETHRREAEKAKRQLQTAFSQAPAGIAVTIGSEHAYVIANPYYEQLIGRSVRLGSTFRETLPEAVGQGYEALLDEVYTTGRAHFERESYALLNKGAGPEDGWYDFVYQPITDTDGRVTGVIQLAIDVTTQVRARRDAETANRAKSDFLTVMSHELRTPLNAISGYAELLEMGIHGPLNDEQRNALERIQRSGRHLLGLINGVLNYAKVDAAAVHYERDHVQLDDILATCEALIAPQVRAKRLEFSYEHCDKTLTACADREKVQQIVLNLLSNAVKFTDPGGRVIMDCATRDGAVVIRVMDTGRGIAPDQIDRIFQPFVQIDAKLTRTHEGTGLGLAISRDLARGMGGDIVVESTPGEGSTFILTLPEE